MLSFWFLVPGRMPIPRNEKPGTRNSSQRTLFGFGSAGLGILNRIKGSAMYIMVWRCFIVSPPQVPAPIRHPLITRQFLRPHRAAGVEFVGAATHYRSSAIFAASCRSSALATRLSALCVYSAGRCHYIIVASALSSCKSLHRKEHHVLGS